jgi:hypothetical protein
LISGPVREFGKQIGLEESLADVMEDQQQICIESRQVNATIKGAITEENPSVLDLDASNETAHLISTGKLLHSISTAI